MAKLQDVILRDTLANRPAAGKAGRLFYDTTNSQLQRDNGSSWDQVEAAPVSGAATFHGVRALQSTNTNLTSGSVVYLGFDGADDYDTDAYHDPASNNTRLTVPTGLGGKYAVTAFSFVTGSAGEGYCVFRKNGATIVGLGRMIASTNFSLAQAATTVALAAGDYLEFGIQVGAASKQSLDAGVVDPTFEMHMYA